jgi:ketosteroid isomerase-like protein
MSTQTKTSETTIRALIEEWTEAVRAKDIGKLMAYYAPDVVVFDILPPLQFVGAAHYRQNWAEWFVSWQGPIGYEMRDLTIAAGDEVAFSRSLSHISGTRTDGEKPMSGCARPFASARSTASGKPRTSTFRCPTT